MRTAFALLCCSALLLTYAGCGTPGPTGTVNQSLDITYHKDIRPILESRCVSCHQQGGVGPYDLTNFEQASKVRELIKNQVVTRKMPPWSASKGCNDYVGDISLSDQQIDTIKKWVEGGTPQGDPSDYKPMEAPYTAKLAREDLTVQIPVRFTPQKRPDDYRCFIVDWPFKEGQGDRYVTGFRVDPDNKKIVHHVIAFIAQPEQVATFEKLDADEEGPGYTCFGGPGNGATDTNGMGWLGAWAPGVGSNVLSTDDSRGIKVKAGSKLIVQMHYNILSADEESDQSSLTFQIAEKVEQEVQIRPWTNPVWARPDLAKVIKGLYPDVAKELGEDPMLIPAGESDVKKGFAVDMATFINQGKPLQILSTTAHMHKLGKSQRISVLHEDGRETCLLDVKEWDFNWQRAYYLKEPFTIKPGDKVKVECTFDNSAENQPFQNGIRLTPIDVQWGEGTRDEMCLTVFSSITPP